MCCSEFLPGAVKRKKGFLERFVVVSSHIPLNERTGASWRWDGALVLTSEREGLEDKEKKENPETNQARAACCWPFSFPSLKSFRFLDFVEIFFTFFFFYFL
jgi:hypothetical protein